MRPSQYCWLYKAAPVCVILFLPALACGQTERQDGIKACPDPRCLLAQARARPEPGREIYPRESGGGDDVIPAGAGIAERLADTIDIAPFGQKLSGENFIGIQWDNPRDVYEVRVAGIDRQAEVGWASAHQQDDGGANPTLRLEWWGSVWPDNGSGGWMRLDDPWNGQWVPVDSKPTPVGQDEFAFKFPPLSKKEWLKALKTSQYPTKEDPIFRRTLKVRVVAENKKMPSQAQLVVLGGSRWREATFNIETSLPNEGTAAVRLDLTNGTLLSLQSLPAPRAVEFDGNGWKAQGAPGQSVGARIRILYADNNDLNSNDMTRVTVRFGNSPHPTGFSFVPQDVLKEGVMRLPNFGTLVCETSRGVTLANDPGPAGDYWAKPVRSRVADRPEMTRAAAMKAIPRLSPPQWVPLGVPCARQEFFVGPGGDWMIWALSLNTDNGRDVKRWCFRKEFGTERQWEKFVVALDTRQDPKFDDGDRKASRRYLQDGYLPLIHIEWNNGPLHYHHALVATILLGDYGDDVTRRGDETVVLLGKLEITNTADTAEPAILNLRYAADTRLTLRDDGAIVSEPSAPASGAVPLYGQISMDKPSAGGAAGWAVLPQNESEPSSILRRQETLKPKQTRLVYFKTPFVQLLDSDELARLQTISFEEEVPHVLAYWRSRLAADMQIDVPDEAINNFYKANLWHNAITTDRDPETGLYNHCVATVRYRVFANETVMAARSMDVRGEHIEAERFLEPMLHYQGCEPLTGRFSTKEGVFHSAGRYTHGQYAMNHGFVLWGAADHYLMTRDRAYLERIAPKLVKGCDFLISERKSTMNDGIAPRTPVYGLCPASSLEDVVEYQYWFATNAYFYLGMKRVAEALADINHPEAQRIEREAEKYRRDIEARVREAATQAAAVQLRDGNFIPYVPSRVFQWRHLTEGWIREALYCALHLATAEVLVCSDPLISWMLDDLEDNIFFSEQSGYNVTGCRQSWFEHGGVTLQPCLLDTPIVYLARDEIPAALRAFWNTYALLIYPDTQCFAEWAPGFGRGGGPVYKTSDESRFIMWLRQLLIWENGDQLWFGRAVPREWLEDGKTIRIERAPTTFGAAGLAIRSEVNKGRIYATVCLPTRSPPSQVWLRIRHPQGRRLRRVLINGRSVEPERIVGPDIRLAPGLTDLSSAVEIQAEY